MDGKRSYDIVPEIAILYVCIYFSLTNESAKMETQKTSVGSSVVHYPDD